MTGNQPMKEKWADWCEQEGDSIICGTRMIEYSRETMGINWCFHCRTRHEFWLVIEVPDGISYYGPSARVEGTDRKCTDLFPGWSREYDYD